jgi:hypothetical protein
MIFTDDDQMIQTLSANRADDALAYGFWNGNRGAVGASSICIPFTRNRNSAPKI